MATKAQQNRDRQTRYRERQRAMGRVQRVYWCHPDDWPKVAALIKKLNKERES